METYFSKLRGLASAAANAVQSKMGRDYEFNLSGQPTGHSGLWTLYEATRRATGQRATVWVFEKQQFFESGLNRQLLNEGGRQRVLSLLTSEASQLARLRHPSVLQVMEPLEDTRTTLMFATEHVLACLEDLITAQRGDTSRSRSGGADDELELDDLAIQKGLLQLCKGLQFLHADAHLVHSNLTPASILVDARGDWKLGGLGFACSAQSGTARGYERDYNMPKHAHPELDYWAPERALDGSVLPAGDVFALGCLAVAAYCGAPPIASNNDIGAYRRELAQLERTNRVARIPDHLATAVHGLLVRDPTKRMTLAQFQSSEYFDNVLVATLRYLEALVEQPADQKIAFMKGLPRVLPQFPARVQRRTVLPLLLANASDRAMLPFILPNVFAIVPQLSAADFATLALPGLTPLFALTDHPQATVVMLESLKLLQEKSSADAFNTHVLPMVYGALLSSHPQVQDRALQAVPLIARSIGPRDLREGLLPRVQHVYSKANILSHKVRALICLHGMLSALDRTSIVEKIMPQLKRTKTREPAVVMAMLSMYEEIGLKHLDRQLVATEIIPVLWAQSVDERLRVPQFDRFMQVIGKLSDRVRTEHRRHMETIQRVDVQAAAVEELFISDTPEGTAGDSSNGSFEAIVKGQASLCNPLAGLPVSQNTPGWEWDAPATNEQPLPGGILKETRVEVDLMGSSSLDVMNGRHAAGPAADINGDDFGSFSSFIPPPKPPPGKQPVASRLRTTGSAPPTARNKLGATKVGALQFGATQSPPLSFGSAQSSPLSFGAGPAVPTQPPLVPTSSSRPSQKHAGGKATDLGDFDPFA